VKAAGRRIKGSNAERALTKILNDAGIPARRVPLSGAMAGYKGDVIIPRWPNDLKRKIEVKRRAHGFRLIYDAIEDNYAVAVRADRSGWLISLRLSDFIELLRR